MRWARAVVVVGVLVALASFAVGTEHQLSTQVDGHSRPWGSAISDWLVSGMPDISTGATVSAEERQAAAACAQVVSESRAWVVTSMAMGGVLVLLGWTASRERRAPEPRRLARVHA